MQVVRKISCIIIPLCLGVMLNCKELKTEKTQDFASSAKIPISIGSHILHVETATTPTVRQRGLMYRPKIRQDEGMLFVFSRPQKTAFWMKNTFIPLDVGYFDSDATLVHYYTMTLDNGKKTYPSIEPVLYAVETNARWFQKKNLKKGATLKLPYPIRGF